MFAMTVLADWPDFRGPWADGHVSAAGDTNLVGLPLRWSETENVKWKTAIPHRGWSTPVVLGRQIWLTTAPMDGHEFFAVCVDAEMGRIVFNEWIFHCDKPEPLGNPLNCYASPSPVVEPGRVYVHFGTYGTACLDTSSRGREEAVISESGKGPPPHVGGYDFKLIWKRSDLRCRHYRGPGSSPVLFNDLLILTFDGVDVQYLVALNKATGATVWKADRSATWNDLDTDGKPMAEGDYRKAYSTPVVADVNGGKQLLTVGAKAAYSYDPFTGRELWKVNHPAFSGAARPLFANGMAFLATGHGKGEVLAVRAAGRGDVTDTHIVWRVSRNTPRLSSPVLANGLLFMVSDAGTASCLDAATGQEVWQQRLPGEYAASLLYGDGRIHAFSQNGIAILFKPARTFEVLATNRLDAGFMASPAVAGKALILRTKTHLYRIEEGASNSTATK
jgi:outer membrane protein assembly factor BamB